MIQHGLTYIDINAPGDYGVFLKDADITRGEGTMLVVGYYFDCFPVGIIVSELFDDCSRIKWFYVDKAFRSIGIGKKFFNMFLDTLKSEGIKEVEVYLPKEQTGLTEIFSIVEQSGFRRIDGSMMTYCFSLQDVCDGPLNPNKKRRSMYALSAAEIFEEHISAFYKRLIQNESLEIKPLFNEDILPESVFILNRNKLSGCIYLTKRGDAIEVSYLYDDDNPMILPTLVTETARKMMDKFSPETMIYAATNKDTVKGMIRDITLGKAEIKEVTDLYVKTL